MIATVSKITEAPEKPLSLFSSEKNHLPAESRPFLQPVQIRFGDDSLKSRVELVRVHKTQNAELPMRNNCSCLQYVERWCKHFFQLSSAELVSDVLGRLNIPADISQSIHHKFISRCDDEVATRLQYFGSSMHIPQLILDVGNDLLRNEYVKIRLGKIGFINTASQVGDVWPASLRRGDAFG